MYDHYRDGIEKRIKIQFLVLVFIVIAIIASTILLYIMLNRLIKSPGDIIYSSNKINELSERIEKSLEKVNKMESQVQATLIRIEDMESNIKISLDSRTTPNILPFGHYYDYRPFSTDMNRYLRYYQALQAEGDLTNIPSFPWPPPKASAFYRIPNKLILGGKNSIKMKGTALKIENALHNTGYSELAYYYIPNGFAVVTRVEQIEKDGKSKDDPYRWSIDYIPVSGFDLDEIIKALFTSRSGMFRVVVFIVNPEPFFQEKEQVLFEQVMEWLKSGLNKLPDTIAELEYNEDYACTALIYEFERSSPEDEPALKLPSGLTGKQHLVMSRIWERLGGE